MEQWIADLLLFSAGISGGILIMTIAPYFSAGRRKRSALVAARARMLADIKEKHNEEILDEALRATEAIKSELAYSLKTLQRTLTVVSMTDTNPDSLDGKPLVLLANPVNSDPSAS